MHEPLFDNPQYLEQIRLEILSNFAALLQFNLYIPSLSKNIKALVDDLLDESARLIKEYVGESIDEDKLVLIEKYMQHNKRIRNTIALLNEGQDLCLERSKAYAYKATLDFNHIANQLATTIKKLEFYSMHDPLTGLHNRRYFTGIFTYEIGRSERHDYDFCLLLIDIDDFKKINDTYGHSSGDEMLKKVAEILTANVRKGDVIARMGGDEIAVLLPETDLEIGLAVAVKLRAYITETLFKDSIGNQYSITVSIGVVNSSKDQKTMESLMSNVDSALYQAKEQGKDTVIIYGNTYERQW